jgi:outer membrane lipoprotein SlyB
MIRARHLAALVLIPMLSLQLVGCAHDSRNTYSAKDVGKQTTVTFGTIVAVRDIDITGENTGAGALLGGATGAGVGNLMGKGKGNAWTTGAGLVAGLAAGAVAEQAISDRKGLEYTVTLESGTTITVVQESPKEERVLAVGERVMVQNNGSYQRVLPANDLPTEIKRPKSIKVKD